MPSSFVDSYAPIVKLLIDRRPARVLDVGCGWGKYGLACREYLPDLDSLDAVEVPQGMLGPQTAIYDRRYIGDIREGDAALYRAYDMVLLIDVIEHMTHRDGQHLLRNIVDGGASALVATPKTFFEQHDEKNPYETHVSVWGWLDFAGFDIDADVSTIDAVIYLLKGRP